MALDPRSPERRAGHRENSSRILAKAGIKFRSKNDGAHLIVTHDGVTADFWPGTGLFIFRTDPPHGWTRGRGVFNLLRRFGVDEKRGPRDKPGEAE